MKQMSIFDCINQSIKDLLLEKFRKYDFDNIYKEELKGNTFEIIKQRFIKEDNYIEYLKLLGKELKKYIVESADSYADFYNKLDFNTFTINSNSITIYNKNNHSVGSIYCVEMIDESLFDNL